MSEDLRKIGQRILANVREGFGDICPSFNPKISNYETLRDLVNFNYVDQEEAHLAIIEGNRLESSNIMKLLTRMEVNNKTYNLLKKKLRRLVNRGYVDQEDAHLALSRRK